MRPVARARISIRGKLLVAFSAIVVLLVTLGLLSLHELRASHQRSEDLGDLQRKVAVYQQLQNDTTVKLYAGASALLSSNEENRDSALRQLNQSYDFSRLEFLASDEGELISRIGKDYDQFVSVMTRAVELDRNGKSAAARKLELTDARPLADDLERLTGQLVNKAETDITDVIEANKESYRTSRQVVIAFALGGVALAVLLGYAMALSFVRPIRAMNVRLAELAAGDFSRQVQVANHDELGELAANLNRMNDELGRLYSDLATASQHKSEFLASMSHELRTPLNAIIGFSEVLREQMFGPLNERQIDYLGDILDSGRHLLLLINDILDLSKVEAGKMELDLSTFSLPGALESALTMVRERASNHGIDLSLDVHRGVGDVEADELKVKQVLFNLLSNAVKFTPDGGRITVRAEHLGETVQVSVSDTGIGIDPADQARIFEQFQQSGVREGTGLGLALARSFVALHGGDLWVDSELGVGSTFTFSLPVGSEPEGEPAVELPLVTITSNGTRPAGPVVLVVEDDARASELLTLYLEGAGFDVVVCPDGESGMTTARDLHPSAIVLDVMLPGMSGWDVLALVKEDDATARIPVVVVSSLDERGQGFALGAADYLVKPVGRDDLLATLGRLLGVDPAGGKCTVLAIDDDPLAVELIGAVLRAEGFTVLGATSGADGLRVAREAQPGLIILDLLMPDMDGFEVAARLRADPGTAAIPVVILTSKTIERADRDRLATNVAHLAAKASFSRTEFVKLVGRYCERRVG